MTASCASRWALGVDLQCLDAMSAADIVALDIKQSARELATECGADVTLNPESVDVPTWKL